MKPFLSALCICALWSSQVLADPFEKIASAGGDITEILFEFGVGDKVTAVDTTSIFPESVNALPKIGYVRALSAEGVLSTGADLLIGADDMGPPAVMDNLAAAGMKVAYAPKGTGAARYADKVNFVGNVLEMPERAAEMIAAYDAELAKVAERRARLDYTPKVLLILSVRDGAPIAAGRDTTGHDIITLSGGTNVADFEGWKPMNAEAIIAAAPDIIVSSTAHMERLGGIEVIMTRPDILATPAGANQMSLVLNPQLMLQFGPRSPRAMQDLLTAFEALGADGS